MDINQAINTLYQGYVLKVVFCDLIITDEKTLADKVRYPYTSPVPVPAGAKVVVESGLSNAERATYQVATVVECGTEELLDLSAKYVYRPIVSLLDTAEHFERIEQIETIKKGFQQKMRQNLRNQIMEELKQALPADIDLTSVTGEVVKEQEPIVELPTEFIL
jgi:hypothetical protein